MSNEIQKNIKFLRVVKFLSIIALLFLILAITTVSITPSASSYEISIYGAFPIHFWFLILSVITIGQIIIMANMYKKNKTWLLGISIIIIAVSILVFMPYIRGYVIYGRGDHLEHIGEAKDIIFTGSTNSYDYYPSIRILTAVSSIVTNIPVINVSTILTRLFPFLFIANFIIFSRFFLRKHPEFMLSLAFASSFLFFASMGNYLSPSLQLSLLLPLVLYLYYQRCLIGVFEKSIVFVLFSVGIVFYHPLIVLFLIIVLSISAISDAISRYKTNTHFSNEIIMEKGKTLKPVAILSVIFITWYFSFSSITNNFVKVFSSIFYGTGESPLSVDLKYSSQYEIQLIDYLRIGFFTYGRYIIILLLLLLSISYITYHIFLKGEKKIVSKYRYFFLSLNVFTFIFFTALSYVSDFSVNWQRFFIYINLFSLVLLPIYFASMLKKNKAKKLKYCAIFCILLFLSFFSLFTFYISPVTNEVNIQCSYGECAGFIWFFENRNTSYLADEINIAQSRYFEALHNQGDSSKNLVYLDAKPADHFGYNISKNIGINYQDSNYLIVPKLAKIVYPSLFPNYPKDWRFTCRDFNMLYNDSTIINTYSNSEIEMHLINPKN